MKSKIKGKNFQKLKKRGNKHWGYPIKIKSKKIRVQAKQKYKDTVFTKLFNNEAAAIQLYNALYQKNLPEDTPIEIVTLDDVLFTKRKNDVAFLVDGHFLIFTEHQSTLNENMPLRLLLYVVQEYEKLIGYRIVKGKQVSNPKFYKKERILLPGPEFFVLYNGTENLKDDNTKKVVTEKLMRLSDAFIEKNESENSLELCVKVIDVRYKSNHKSLHQQAKQQRKGKKKEEREEEKNLSLLGEYSYFISKVEEYKKEYKNLEDAIKAAAKHCVEHGILREFLLKNETEVVAMLLGVYDEELEKQAIREEEREKADRRVANAETRVRKEERAKAAKERENAANVVIDIALGSGYSNEEILATLQKRLGIKEKQAEEYLRKFYDKSL